LKLPKSLLRRDIMGLVALCLILMIIAFSVFEMNRVKQSSRYALKSVSNFLAKTLSGPVQKEDLQAIEELLEGAMALDELSGVCVYSIEQKIITGRFRGNRKLADCDLSRVTRSKAEFIIVDIKDRDESIGQLLAWQAFPFLTPSLVYMFLWPLLLMVFLLIILNVILGSLVRKTIAPIISLSVAVEKRGRFLESQLQQAKKMEAIGQLTGSIAHDFNNLLTIILGNIDFVQSFHDLPEAVDEALGDSVSAGRDARELIKSLLVFAKNETVQAERLNVVNLLTSFTPILARVLPKCIQLKFEYDGYNAIVLMNRYALENAMLNLVFNAKDALPKGGIIQIRCSVGDKTSGTPLLQGRHNVTIVVKDDGIGMTEPQRASAIEPFFTTKSLGQGSGLGLSSVFGSVSQAGGTLEINSKLNQGTEVILNIPTLKDAEKSSHEASLSALEEHEKIKDLMRTNSFSALRDKEILLVDDNYSIRSLDKKNLRSNRGARD